MTPEEYQDWLKAKQDEEAAANQAGRPRVMLPEDYEWGAIDAVQAPFALIIGGLRALPTASFGFKCSKNTTSARNSLLEAFNYFNATEDFDGV